MPLTNAQLRAEIDRLTQAMVDRSKVPSHLPKFTGKRGEDVREWLFQVENACRINGIAIEDASTRLPGIAGSAMEKPASGWFLHWSSTIRNEEHTWGVFREHVFQHFEASNYQSVLRERLQRLKQTADIETYNGDYSALIFRVEGMSVLDQVLNYANGLKPRTRSYVKLENPETLSDAMDLAVKYEVTHFVEDARDRQIRSDKKKTVGDDNEKQPRRFKGKPFRGKGRFKPRAKSESKETRTCYFCKKPGHVKADCYAWKNEQAKQGNDKPRQ
uniref:CCHC-type domain-containing protein n=1 Tax=Phytophthora ramorum TaxID=164328 RepID=H3GWM8_PHYRM